MESSHKVWKKSLPSSRLVRPKTVTGNAKYLFWHCYKPLHPFIRDGLLRCKILKHKGRQKYLLGYIAPGWTIEQVVELLISRGFGNHFIAWVDDDELVGLRYVENFSNQYHIRIFKDGEVRGHYEYTPECYPILHFKAIGMQHRREEFLKLLGDCVVAA